MQNDEYMTLVGHIQVLDVPLVSLYYDTASDRYFVAITLFGCDEMYAYLFVDITVETALKYMREEITMLTILALSKNYYYYKNYGNKDLELSDLRPISKINAYRLFSKEAGVKPEYDRQLAYKSVGLKNFLESKRNN